MNSVEIGDEVIVDRHVSKFVNHVTESTFHGWKMLGYFISLLMVCCLTSSNVCAKEDPEIHYSPVPCVHDVYVIFTNCRNFSFS